jgi:hypothetical protein
MYVHDEYAGKDGVSTIDRRDASSEEKKREKGRVTRRSS